MEAKPNSLSGRQLWQSLRVGVVVTRNPPHHPAKLRARKAGGAR